MVYDIVTGLNRKERDTIKQQWDWGETITRLKTVTKCAHTLEQYKLMTKDQRVDAKDVGFFIGGYADKRKVVYRQFIVLDLDDVKEDTLDNVRTFFDGCQYLIHSTHSSTPEEPRYRVVAPLSQFIMCDQYSSVLRTMHKHFGIPIDESTFDFNRIMFLPSVPADVEYYFESHEGEPFNVSKIIDNEGIWKDLSDVSVPKTAQVQNPSTKGGLVGSFCAKFTIREAIETYLSDVWKKESNGRYTYSGASTTSGGIIYEELYLYSIHSTDPHLGRCHNAYDAVRLYKFGDSKQGEKLMNEFCVAIGLKPDSNMRHALTIAAITDEEAKARLEEGLKVHPKTGELYDSIGNVTLILDNDPELADTFATDLFSEMPVLKKSPPWRKLAAPKINFDCKDLIPSIEMDDTDEAFLHSHFEDKYGLSIVKSIDRALKIVCYNNAFHPIRDYLSALEWDGIERLSKIFIECFGVKDTNYSREVGIKTFVGAVQRVFVPASKMDYIPVLVGAEGLGKSRFIKRMGKLWGSDTIYTFNGGKDAYEQLRGSWIIEIPELKGIQNRSTNSRKAFITKGADKYRGAYLKYVKTYERQSIFLASSNDMIFLDDPSEEGRRWWGLLCNPENIKIDIHSDYFLDLVNKYWAEATYWYNSGVIPMLSPEADRQAKTLREVHKAENMETGGLIDYLDMPVPEDWYKKSFFDKQHYYNEQRDTWSGEPRDYICSMEVAREFYGYSKTDTTSRISLKVSDAIQATELFTRTGIKKRFGEYGAAIAWVRNTKLKSNE